MPTRKAPKHSPAKPATGKVQVRTPNKPGYVGNVDAVRYERMRKALWKVLPRKAPGMTQDEMFRAVEAADPDFPGAHPWWVKAVQLDQEARGAMAREPTKPLRWHRP